MQERILDDTLGDLRSQHPKERLLTQPAMLSHACSNHVPLTVLHDDVLDTSQTSAQISSSKLKQDTRQLAILESSAYKRACAFPRDTSDFLLVKLNAQAVVRVCRAMIGLVFIPPNHSLVQCFCQHVILNTGITGNTCKTKTNVTCLA